MPEENVTPDQTNQTPELSEDMVELNSILDQAEAEDAQAEGLNEPEKPGTQAAPVEDPELSADDLENGTQTPDDNPETRTDKDGVDGANVDPPQEPSNEDGKKDKSDKELERQDRSWKKINEEKERIKAEREELQRERDAIKKQQPAYSAEDYDAAAKKFQDEGKFELAELAERQAENLRKNPEANRQIHASREAQQLESAQTDSWNRAKLDVPEILDKESPIHKELVEFLGTRPDLMRLPDGPHLAAIHVRDKLVAGRVSGLSQENEQLKARLKKLEAATSIPANSSSPNIRRTEKSFSEMTLNEMEKSIEREFAEANR